MPTSSSLPPAIKTAAKLAVSISLLAVMVAWVGLEELLSAARGLDYVLALVSFLLSLGVVAIGGVNIMVLTHGAVPELPKWPVFVAYVRSWVIGSVAPGRFGDLSLAHFLKPLGVTYGLGLAVFTVDKVISFASTAAIMAVGLVVYVGVGEAVWAAVLAIILTAVAVAVVLNARIRALVRARLLGRHSEKFAGYSVYLRDLLGKHPWLLALNTLITVVRTIVMAAAMWVMLRALGISIDPLAVLFIQSIAQGASWIPISIAGVGVRESTATVLYTALLGVAAAPVLNANLLVLVLSYARSALLFVLFGTGGAAERTRAGETSPRPPAA